MKQKKTCESYSWACAALRPCPKDRRRNPYCELGYTIRLCPSGEMGATFARYVPTEPCPKPMTLFELFACKPKDTDMKRPRSKPVWCVRQTIVWCACRSDQEPLNHDVMVPTLCGYWVRSPRDVALRRPTCSTCRRRLKKMEDA